MRKKAVGYYNPCGFSVCDLLPFVPLYLPLISGEKATVLT